MAEPEGEESVAVEGAEPESAAEGETVDGAREERVVGEAGEAGVRERGDGRVRVGNEDVEGRRGMWSGRLRSWFEGTWRRGRGEAARGEAWQRPRGGVAVAAMLVQFRFSSFFSSTGEGRKKGKTRSAPPPPPSTVFDSTRVFGW